jgi:hypothetical protein
MQKGAIQLSRNVDEICHQSSRGGIAPAVAGGVLNIPHSHELAQGGSLIQPAFFCGYYGCYVYCGPYYCYGPRK